MSDLNDRVIEAAAKAFNQGLMDAIPDHGSIPYETMRRKGIEAAIRAADAARAPEIIAAVSYLAEAACDRCSESGGTQRDKDRVFADARRELLALFGIEESS